MNVAVQIRVWWLFFSTFDKSDNHILQITVYLTYEIFSWQKGAVYV